MERLYINTNDLVNAGEVDTVINTVNEQIGENIKRIDDMNKKGMIKIIKEDGLFGEFDSGFVINDKKEEWIFIDHITKKYIIEDEREITKKYLDKSGIEHIFGSEAMIKEIVAELPHIMFDNTYKQIEMKVYKGFLNKIFKKIETIEKLYVVRPYINYTFFERFVLRGYELPTKETDKKDIIINIRQNVFEFGKSVLSEKDILEEVFDIEIECETIYHYLVLVNNTEIKITKEDYDKLGEEY